MKYANKFNVLFILLLLLFPCIFTHEQEENLCSLKGILFVNFHTFIFSSMNMTTDNHQNIYV